MTESSPTETATARAPRARRKAAPRKTSATGKRKTAPRKGGASRGRLEKLLSDLAARASKAGAAIAGGAAEGATTAKAALGRARSAGRQAIRASAREWKKLDTPRKIEFVAAMLSALAAASGTIAKGKRKRNLFR